MTDNTNPVNPPQNIPAPEPTEPDITPEIAYVPDPAVERLNPAQPELWTDAIPPESVLPADAPLPPATSRLYPFPTDDLSGGGAGATETGVLRGFGDPFVPAEFQRPSARDVFSPVVSDAADPELLARFVTNTRLTDLWTQLDQLQEEVIRNVRAERQPTDAYQQDLLYASTLLLQNPANYDDARQIILRVRADLMREQRVAEDTRKHVPRLLAYYAVWFIATLIALDFDAQFRQTMPDGLPILKLSYPAIIFGIFGALFNGVLGLLQHANVKRDFDPTHTSWYLINPLIGGFLGIIVFIFFVVTGSSFTPDLATRTDLSTTQAPLPIWLLAFIVGWQQNIVFRILNRFLNTVLPEKETAIETRPGSAPMTGTTTITTTTNTPPTPPSSTTPLS